jgi:hypothetical protein
MLEFLQGKASDRKLRLFACACCRQVWHMLTNERSRNAVEVAERFADGNATAVELVESHHAAKRFYGPWLPDEKEMAADAASDSAQVISETITSVASDVVCAAMNDPSGDCDEAIVVHKQVVLINDIFGHSFRPSPAFPAALLAWNDGTVRRIAQGIYEERRMPEGTLDNARLAVLADALEESGCTDPDMLAHLRGPGPHVRGCWVLDLLLGKK